MPLLSSGFRIFTPKLAGATLRERMVACAGALVGIALTSLITGLAINGAYLPLIVAPMGASAVLLFAVPASPLAQPWSIVGGNTLSALVGVAVSHAVDDRVMAAGLAVSLAILVMSFARCLHPPGGAAALTAVLGGAVVGRMGWLFPLVPVGVNSMILLGTGLVAHRLTGRAYPHRPAPLPVVATHATTDPPPQLRVGFRDEDIDAALRAMHETLDVDRDDVARLVREVELQAAVRASGPLRCADIMSRDVVTVRDHDTVETARSLLLAHDIRVVPVLGDGGRLLGTVGLRELAHADGTIAACMTEAATASAGEPVVGLTPLLTAGRHAVVIVDSDRRVQGLVTQTDLLVAVTRALSR